MQFIRSYKKILLTSVIIIIVFFAFYETGLAQRILFPVGLLDKVKTFIFGDNAIHASDYKDGTILLIKPIATGVGEGRYEAGDIVSIMDGEEMYKRFGDTDFLGYEEKSKLIPLYLKQKLTEEQTKELLAPVMLEGAERPIASRDAQTATGSSRSLKSLQDDKGRGESAPSPRLEERAGGEVKKMTKRRQYGVDYTLVLSDKDILTIRQEKALDKIPEVKFQEIINKDNKFSYAEQNNFVIPGEALAETRDPGEEGNNSNNDNSLKTEVPSAPGSRLVGRDDNKSVVDLPEHLVVAEKTFKGVKRLANIIIPRVRAATESVKTVDTGGYADYRSLSTWEAGEQSDLTSLDLVAVAKCRHATATSTVDSARVDLDGWTTDATRYIKIWTDPTESYRHNGKWDSAKYYLSVANNSAMYIYEDYVRLDGLQISTSGANGNGQAPLTFNGTTDANDIQVSNSIIRGHNHASYTQSGFWAGTSNHVALKMWNTLIYDIRPIAGNNGIYGYGSNSINSHIYNVTISGGEYGLRWISGTAYIKNVLALNSLTYDFNTATYQINCASEDATADDNDADGVSGSNRINQSFVFADKANYDFRLHAIDNTAQNYGTSTVSAIGFTNDIKGQGRSGTWDIGADEMVIRQVYRSVGPGKTTALATGATNPMTINGYTATFTSDLPNNVGVGDFIQYDRDNNGTVDSVAFISGRTSSKIFSVQDIDGYMASSTIASSTYIADREWSLYRAFTSLSDAVILTENAGIPTALQHFDIKWSSIATIGLATTTIKWNFACYADATDSSAPYIDIYWKTSTNTPVRFFAPASSSEVGISQRHKGVWDDSKFNITVNEGGGSGMDTNIRYLEVDGLQVKVIVVSKSSSGHGFVSRNGFMTATNNIIRGELASDIGHAQGIYENTVGGSRIYNNIVYGFNSNASCAGIVGASTLYTTYIYNNTVINSYYGILDSSGGNTLIKNNIVQNCTDGYDYSGVGFNATCDYNISDLVGDAPGSHSKNGVKVKFKRPNLKDYHLVSFDTVALKAGTNLSADANLPFATDIDGETRPVGIAWDIGADEVSINVTKVGTNPYARFNDSTLVGHWSFDGNKVDWSSTTAEVMDSSRYGSRGNTWYQPKAESGAVGQSLSFDGIGDMVVVADPADGHLDVGTSDFTVCAWFKAHAVDACGHIAGKWNYSTTNNGYAMGPCYGWYTAMLGSDNVPCGIVWYNMDFQTGAGSLIANKWQNPCLTVDRDGYALLYLDGVLKSSANISSFSSCNLSNSYDFIIGARSEADSVANGNIDEVRVYNRALSADEIMEFYRVGSSKLNSNDSYVGNATGLVGYWTFDGADIDWKLNSALDTSGLGNNGTMYYMSNTTSGVSGISGQALKFDGLDDYISIPNLIETGSHSISAWINSDALPANDGNEQWVFVKGDDISGGWGFGLDLRKTSGVVTYNADVVVSGSEYQAKGGKPVTGKWVNMIGVFNSTAHSVTLYVDGELIQTTDTVNSTLRGGTDSEIGNLLPYSNYFKGKIDEVRVYNRALSVSEIQDIYILGQRKMKVKARQN